MKQASVTLASIEMDTSIQCRAVIDTATVSEYADRMIEGDKFPAVVLFEEGGKLWIGDGWHRVMAARQMGAIDIAADVRPGGRKEALQYALGANAANGLRRSNADKRRCVEIALAEFGDLSSRQIAVMCGVSNHMVDDARPVDVGKSPTPTRTDTLGRKQPARRPPAIEPEGEVDKVRQAAIAAEEARYDKPETAEGKQAQKPKQRGVGVVLSNNAIAILQRIPIDDPLRQVGLKTVAQWIKVNK
jgi:hypothetical protein